MNLKAMIDKPFGHKITQLMQVTLKSIIIFFYKIKN